MKHKKKEKGKKKQKKPDKYKRSFKNYFQTNNVWHSQLVEEQLFCKYEFKAESPF